MKKLLTKPLGAIFVLWATATMAQPSMMMNGMKDIPMDKTTAEQTEHTAKGRVTKIDADAGVVTLSHEPVKSLDWPAMTMGFKLTDKKLLDKLAVGKTVDFTFVQTDKGYVITSVR